VNRKTEFRIQYPVDSRQELEAKIANNKLQGNHKYQITKAKRAQEDKAQEQEKADSPSTSSG